MRARSLVAAAILACVAAPLSAQKLSITPFIGEMVPLKTTVIDTSGGSATYFRFNAHTLYGLRLAKELTPTVALQLQGGAGKGDMEIISGGTPLSLATSLWFADVRARVRIVGPDRANLGVLVGAGWTQFKMGLFDAAHILDSGNDLKGKVTGIVGLGLRAHLTGDASFTADLTDRFHSQPIEGVGLTNAIKPTQHDMTMAFGLNFPLGS